MQEGLPVRLTGLARGSLTKVPLRRRVSVSLTADTEAASAATLSPSPSPSSSSPSTAATGVGAAAAPGGVGALGVAASGAAPAVNARNLEWALSRFNGYVGVTGVLNRMHGERFAAAPALYATMLEEVGRRGLIYLDARPGGAAPQSTRLPPFRAVDLVLDAPAVRGEVDERLGQLERVAREGGTAVGLAEGPTPMVIDRIAAWATALPLRGYALVPVSAVIVPR